MPSEPTRVVTVRWATPGYHRWPEAADVLASRAYLAATHRHLFHYEVSVRVAHNDRDVEFHELLAYAREQAPWADVDLGRMSCEDLAERVARSVMKRWPGRWCRVSVFEDGEVGATLTWEAEADA